MRQGFSGLCSRRLTLYCPSGHCQRAHSSQGLRLHGTSSFPPSFSSPWIHPHRTWPLHTPWRIDHHGAPGKKDPHSYPHFICCKLRYQVAQGCMEQGMEARSAGPQASSLTTGSPFLPLGSHFASNGWFTLESWKPSCLVLCSK